MRSSSELQRVSVSAARVLRPNGTLTLSPDARLAPPAAATEPSSAEKAAENKQSEEQQGANIIQFSITRLPENIFYLNDGYYYYCSAFE